MGLTLTEEQGHLILDVLVWATLEAENQLMLEKLGFESPYDPGVLQKTLQDAYRAMEIFK